MVVFALDSTTDLWNIPADDKQDLTANKLNSVFTRVQIKLGFLLFLRPQMVSK